MHWIASSSTEGSLCPWETDQDGAGDTAFINSDYIYTADRYSYNESCCCGVDAGGHLTPHLRLKASTQHKHWQTADHNQTTNMN